MYGSYWTPEATRRSLYRVNWRQTKYSINDATHSSILLETGVYPRHLSITRDFDSDRFHSKNVLYQGFARRSYCKPLNTWRSIPRGEW